MEPLIEQLKKELQVSDKDAREMILAIVAYIENQHPLLTDLVQELASRELEK